jgi:DNA-binding HxlR family transcriptional regulator
VASSSTRIETVTIGRHLVLGGQVDPELACPAETVLELVSGRWKLLVIFWLLKGEHRFNQLQRNLGGITHRTLAKTLREMETDGLVRRRDHGEIPPRVDYRLTPLGASLAPILQAMERWTIKNNLASPSIKSKRQGAVR